MKTKPPYSLAALSFSSPALRRLGCVLLASAGLLAALNVRAALIPKADNATALNLGTSWIGGVAPGNGDIGLWDSTVVANTNDAVLGTNLAWGGIQIANPAGPITIPADGNTLTNGASGINLFSATAGLTLSNNVSLSAPQYWQVGNGQTLDLEGALTNLSAGSVVMFSFDTNAASQAIVNPAAPGSVLGVSGNNTLFSDGAIGEGTGQGVIIGTVNDVDFAALNANNQVVPASTVITYTANPAGTAPTLTAGTGTGIPVYDFTNTNSVGGRIASTVYVMGFRFNTPQLINSSASTYTYNGVGSWNVLFKASNTLDVNTILMTTNLGNSYVVFTPAGTSVMRIADTPNELVVYQNNPAASLVWQLPISNRSAGGVVSKLGVGTMEYQAACTYTGGTQIHGGTLLVDGAGTAGTGQITVFSGANFEGQGGAVNPGVTVIASGGTNSVLLATANGQFVQSNSVAFYAGTTWLQFIYSNSIVPSATTAALLVTNGTLTASNTVNIIVACSSLTPGQFPLVKYASLVTNSARSTFPFSLTGIQPHVSAYLSNNVANNSVDLVVTSVAQPLHWAMGSGVWDIGVTANWQDVNGNPTTYQQEFGVADDVLLNDAAGGPSPITVTLNTKVLPGTVTVNDSVMNYTISGSGSIGGFTGLTKTGTGELVLSTTNTFVGGLNLNGGMVNFSALNNLGAGAINFNGGTLQYNGNTDDISTRLVTFEAGGATIDTAGQTVSYANAIGNSGPGGLTKTDSGTLTLNGSNLYTGNTTVNQGTLALGASAAISSSPAIIVNSGATLDTASSGVGLSLAAGQILAGVGTVRGEVSLPTGAVITPATNGVFGTLSLANDLGVVGGALAIDVSTTNVDLIAVTGNVGITNGFLQVNAIGALTNGVYRIITYGGSLLSGPGSSAKLVVNGFLSANQLATLSDAKPGEIDLVISIGAHDSITWAGTANTWGLGGTPDWLLNGLTPWAFTNLDTVTFNDAGGGIATVLLTNAMAPSLVTVSNSAETYDFQDGTGVGAGSLILSASVIKDGTGTLINETADTYYGSTTIKNGVLQIGNGSIGDIGTGNITNNAGLVFNQGDYNSALNIYNTHYVTGPISGAGNVNVEGQCPVVLEGNNTYSGGTAISGTLQVGLATATGSLGMGPVTNNGSLVVDRTGSLALSNNISGSGPVAFIGTGTVTYSGSNSYTANTYISNGIVKLGSVNAIPVDGAADEVLQLDGNTGKSAGILDLNGHNLAVDAISGVASTTNGVIYNNGGTSTVTNTLAVVGSGNTTYSGMIEDNTGSGGKIALVVEGSAYQVLNAANLAGNNFAYSGGTIISNATIQMTGVSGTVNSIGLGTGPVTLYNGTLYSVGGADEANGTSWNSLPNNITIPTNYTGTIYGPARGEMLANITGSGTLHYNNVYVRGSINGNWSAFTGQIVFGNTASGGQLGIGTTNGLGRVFCTNNAATATGVTMYNTVAGTPTIPIGELADDGSTTIEATSSGNAGGAAAIFAVGSLNTSTTFGGSIIDYVGIVKVGTGTWTLTNSILTYTNLTTVSNGVLVLSTNVSLPYSSPITIASPGILDVTATNPFVLGAITNQTLQGNGTLRGGFALSTYGTVAPGGTNAIGTLTVTGDANLSGGTVLMELNRTNATGKCDALVAATIEASGSTLLVTNIGPGLFTGATFTLFSQPVSGFASVTLPATDPTGLTNYVWANNLSVNGSIQLTSGGLAPVATNPTNVVAFVSNGNLTLTWPSDHIGWYLQVQTNSLGKGLGTNWVDVPGSSSVGSEIIPISPTNPAIFYRLSLNP